MRSGLGFGYNMATWTVSRKSTSTRKTLVSPEGARPTQSGRQHALGRQARPTEQAEVAHVGSGTALPMRFRALLTQG